jgi:hypothetical protein
MISRDISRKMGMVRHTAHTKKKKNSVAWVGNRTISTELPQLVGEVSDNFCGYRVPRGQCDGTLWPYSSKPGPLIFLSSSSSILLMRQSGPRSRPTTSQKTWKSRYRTRASWYVARNSDHWITEVVVHMKNAYNILTWIFQCKKPHGRSLKN